MELSTACQGRNSCSASPVVDTVRPSAYPCRPSKGRPVTGQLNAQVESNETHISAQQDQARANPRFSRSYGHQGRASCSKAPTRKGPRAVGAVSKPPVGPTNRTNSGLNIGPGNRFGKDNRLLDAAAFGRVFAKATRSRDRIFTILCRRNEHGVPRLGLAVSKKNCRRATGRNRIKRAIRESFREHKVLLSNLDIVVMNQSAAATASNQELIASLETHWHRCQKAKRIPQES